MLDEKKKMNKFNGILTLLLFTLNLFAGTIKGKVTLGTDRSTISGVSVLLMDKKVRFSTDENGNFVIPNLTKGIYQLEVNQLGYKKGYIQNITVEENVESFVEINLIETPFQLNEVVVTGSLNKHLLKDSPVITEIISQKDLNSSGTSEVGEVLRNQTGIEIGSSISQTANVRLQGLRKNQVIILVDGERISGKVDDAVDINQIPVQSIERIEVVKGPMSSIYGSDAIGGVVNIITKTPSLGVTTAQGGVTVGSNGRQDYVVTAGHGTSDFFGSGKDLNVLVSAGWNKYFGVDYTLDDYFMEIPEYDRKNVSIKINAKPIENFKLDIKTDLYKDRLEWYAGIFDPSSKYYYIDNSTNDKFSYAVSGQYAAGSTIIKLSGNESSNDHGSSEKTNSGFIVRTSTTQEKISTVRGQVTLLPYTTSTLTIGTELNNESVHSQRILGLEKEIRNNVLYAEDEWAIGNFTLNFGSRYSDNSRYGSFFAPRFSALVKATDHLTLRASYGRGFRSPSLLELFIDYNNAGVGYTVIGAPDLQPEKSHGINFGFDYARESMVWFRLNAYYNTLTNLIDYYYKSTSSPVLLSYRNISSAKARGIDLDIDTHPFDELGISIGYNYNRTTDGNGSELPFHSPHTVNAKIGYEITELHTTLNLRGRYYSRQLVKDEQTNTAAYSGGTATTTTGHSPTYEILDGNLTSIVFLNFEFSAGINNILNKKVYPFGQIKGREFFTGIKYQL